MTIMRKMNKCILCGKETKGSVGAAGYHWPMICQSCKDIEDRIISEKVKIMSIAGKIFNNK